MHELQFVASRLVSVSRAIGLAFVVAALVLASETLHLTIRGPYFLHDLGSSGVLVLLWYAGAAILAGVAVGLFAPSPAARSLCLSAIWYLIISLKILGVDAGLLADWRVTTFFVMVSVVLALLVVRFLKSRSLSSLFPVLVVVAYANACLGVAAGWGLGGGRLIAFLLSERTVLVACACGGALAAATVAQQRCEQSGRWRGIPLSVSFVGFVIAIVVSMHRLAPRAVTHVNQAGGPDVFVISVDALRSDELRAFVASHPDSELAQLVKDGTAFENVVSFGPSTDEAIEHNTFLGTAKTHCRQSLPWQLGSKGYFTAMLLGRIGRRFEGSVCYDYFFGGSGPALVARYSVPALVLSGARGAMRDKVLTSEELVAQLAEVARSSAPLYAYTHLLELHAPVLPHNKKNDARYLDLTREYMRGCYVVACDPEDPHNKMVIDNARAAYDEAMQEIDIGAKGIHDIAKARNRPYIVILTADHGELFGEHGGFAHGGGFVPELLDVPFVVFDSRVASGKRRCELMLESQALHATLADPANVQSATYPDHDVLSFETPPLGRAQISKRSETIDYEISPGVVRQAGTWRNVHKQPRGTLAYPIDRCL